MEKNYSVLVDVIVHMCRLIGATVIVVGLYALIWGKNNDHVKSVDKENSSEKHKTLELPFSTSDDNKTSSLDNI